jgi:HK97 family phage portal protein
VGFFSSVSNIFRPSAVRAAEDEYREGPYTLPISGGFLPRGSAWNFWQFGQDVLRGGGTSAMVEACVSAYAQTIASCPGSHWVSDGNGGRTRQSTAVSSLARILRYPNDYESISDFLVNAVKRLYSDGNAYALAIRNARFEISELHLMSQGQAQIGAGGEIFYQLSGNEIMERRQDFRNVLFPARDVLHLRLFTPRFRLMGETPLQAAALDVATNSVIGQQQVAFYTNQARPSYILSTDTILTREQTKALRDWWDERTRGLAAGETVIATAGLKPIPLHTSAQEAQLAEVLRLSDERIALTLRVPLQILGMGGTPYASTEMLYQSWLGSGLGFALNHIEESFGRLFNLRGQPEEYVEFDTQALLRSSRKEMIEALVAGVHGGLIAPNEGRAVLEYPAVEFGDVPRLQQQDVPLSYGFDLVKQMQQAAQQAALPAPSAPAEQPPPPPQRDSPNERSAVVRSLFAAADDYDRRAA